MAKNPGHSRAGQKRHGTARASEASRKPAAPAPNALDPAAMLVFAAIAREQGVRGAASRLSVPRSTVSRRLAQLETDLGAPLVVRTSRRFALTELGRALATQCEALEALLARSEQAVRGATLEPAGVLRIAAAPVLGEEILPAIVAELVARYPRLSIDLRLSVDYDDLRRDGVDVALRAWALEDAADLFATKLGVSVTGCYVSPDYARAHGVPETPADLARHACILVGAGKPRTWEFAREQRVRVDGPVRLDSFRLGCALAVRGLGVFRTARMFAAPFVASGALVPILESHWPSTSIHAVHAGPNPPVPSVRAFIDLAREHIRGVL